MQLVCDPQCVTGVCMCGCQQECIPTDNNVWKLQHRDAPRQRNAEESAGVNCGVHVCATGERLINGMPVDFTGIEMDNTYRCILEIGWSVP